MRGIIRHLCFVLLCGLALAAPAANPRTILVMGDSLSAAYGLKTAEGWVSLLEKKLQAEKYPVRVINASISGETSGGALQRLETLLQQHRPQVLVIELGANDGLRGYPIKSLRDNLEQIVRLGKKYQAKILLIGTEIPVNYGPRYTRQYKQVFTELAQAQELALLPSLLGNIPLHTELMQADGLHPLATAQPMILDRVWPVLLPLL